MFTKTLAALAVTSVLTTAVYAQSVKVGDLTVSNPIARATPPGAKVGGGYITITNNGSAADRLIGGTASFAGKIEIHEMKVADGIMRMKEIEGGLEIPAGETVKLMPGGNHVMFMKLSDALKVDENRKVTLTFKNAGNVDVMFNVKSIAETMKMRKMGKHKMGDHKGHMKKKMKMNTDG
ncbi:MAG: copper chaperone PCu(A)C [Rhizobiaceae bacterium]